MSATPNTTPTPRTRIGLVDALRGSALLGILIVHAIEHFDMGHNPRNPPEWLRTANAWSHDTVFFLFSGKAYAIFAMMFGLSFWLILDAWSRRGVAFRGRFLWRLTLLGVGGYLYGLVYCGEVLSTLALGGVFMLLIYRLGDRTLGWLAVVLLLQPPAIWQVSHIITDPDYAATLARPLHWDYYGTVGRAAVGDSMVDMLRVNAWTGVLARMTFTVEVGRYLQVPGLMILGLLLGRHRVFEDRARAMRLAIRVLAAGVLGFAILYPLSRNLQIFGVDGMARVPLRSLVGSYVNVAMMAVWVGGFILLYHGIAGVRRALDLLAPYGRMSLSGYVTQGIIGVPLFYGFGFGLYRYMGPFYSTLFGIGFLIVQLFCAHAWMRRYHYGPFEWAWRAATFLSWSTPLRKRDPEVLPAVAPAPEAT